MKKGKNEILGKIISANPEPIGIFTLPIEKHLEYQKLIKEISENAPINLRQKFSSEKYSEHICNQSNQNIFESFPELKQLKSDINNLIAIYIDEIGFVSKENIINDAWINISREKAVLAWHYHLNSFISHFSCSP